MVSSSALTTANRQQSTESPLRVVQVIPQMGCGGAERVVGELLGALDAEVVVSKLCVLGMENTFPDRLRGLVEEPVFLGYRGSLKDVRGLWRCVRRLRSLIQEWRANVVHSHLWPAARVAGLAVRGLGVAHVVHVQDTRPWVRGTSARARLQRLLTRRTVLPSQPTFVAVSQAAANYNAGPLKLERSRLRVIPNGVDPDTFRPSERASGHSGPVRIGMAARFSPEKGHRHLLEAVAKLRSRETRLEVLLAGEGSLRLECARLAAEWGIADCVRFLGLLEDVPRFLQSLDLFVLPSVAAEGLPLSVLEAMSTGLPVIATDIAGVPEVIADCENGLLVPPGDVEALAAAIERLVRNEAQRQSLGLAARRTVQEHFTLQQTSRQIEEAYREAVSELSHALIEENTRSDRREGALEPVGFTCPQSDRETDVSCSP